MRLFLPIAIVLVMSFAINSQQQKSKLQKPQQAAPTDQRGTQESPVVVKVLPNLKTPEEVDQETKDRNTKAANDGNVVELTAVLAGVAILQLFVYSYQAYKLRQTVQASGEQSEAMERHVGEAARSATAMETIANKIEDGNKMIMRAYVTVAIGAAVFQERNRVGQNDLKFEGKMQVLNTGNTPARKVRIRKQAAIVPIPIPDGFNFSIPEEPEAVAYAALGAHQSYVISAIVPDFVADAEVAGIKDATGNKVLCAWGTITYEDIFGETHITKFGQQLLWYPNGTVYGFYIGGQNEAD
jgi:hypothetical protein